MLALQAASFVLSGGPISAAEMGRGEPDLSAIAKVNLPAPRAAAMNPAKAPKIAPTYSVQVGLDGEIFPVFANHASLQPQDERTWGTVAVTVHNSSAAVISDRITVQVPGWSDKEIQMIEVPAGE